MPQLNLAGQFTAHMPKVIFYCESAICGGHEKMALMADGAIRRHYGQIEITWLTEGSNRQLVAALDKAGSSRIQIDSNPSFQFMRNPFSVIKKVLPVRRALKALNPDLIVVVAGGITNGFDGVIAARLAGIPICSYIPLAQSPLELGRRFPRLRAAAASLFFRAVPRYITIDTEQKNNLRSWHPGAEIAVVENFLPGPIPSSGRTPEAKQRLGIPGHLTTLAVIGRITFWQKAQDWLVSALGEGSFLDDKALVFVGDGHDSAELARLIADSAWRAHLFQFGWMENLDSVYEAVDLLLIPSRQEGVPQVMLEALARRIPVVASDRDGMKSWLPPEWRFPFRDAAAMQSAMGRALAGEPRDCWAAIERRLEVAKDERRFGVEFGEALAGLCARGARHE
jgi:glycosyltransferase involved in cell wall biosynthesis